MNSKHLRSKSVSVLLVFMVFGLLAYKSYGQNKTKDQIPRVYVSNRTTEKIKIDGIGDERSWQNAKYSDPFVDIVGIKKPPLATTFKMLWDAEYIYFFAELEDPHIWATLKQRDTIVYYNNDFEIFIDPDGDSHNYYEFEFNAMNTIWDLFLTKPYRNGNVVLNDWDANGLESAVHIDGTLNSPNDIDNKWSIEIAIPLRVFNVSYDEKTGLRDKFWRINFSRVHWEFQLENGKYGRKKNADGTYIRENNWVWSPQGVIAMHRPETWGYVYFSEDGKSSFTSPKDDYIKRYLYKLHNNFKSNELSSNSIKTPATILDKIIIPEFETHESGYNICVVSPFSGKKIILKEDGKVIEK